MIELASILVLGIFAQWLAWRIKLPAILPLIVIGLLVGPFSTFLTPDGSKLIDGDEIFTGHLLFSFVAISVGIILFEGGLTLKISEIKHLAVTVRNLLTIGVFVTFIGGGLAAHFLLGLNYRISFLFGALIIVSGPTVITPILRNVRPNQKINTVLKWEGILIDPLGALIAVLVYEFVRTSRPNEEFTLVALKDFFLTISSGFFIGVIAAIILFYMIRKNRIPNYLRNVIALALVILTFAFSEILQNEAGLMAATVMGIVLANLKLDEIKNILSFKEDITLILISVLFILLSSRINMDQITKLGVESMILFGVVIFIIRPVGVFLSTLRSNLTLKEKIFISWIGPKGIVAAAVASLFSLELLSEGGSPSDVENAEMLLPLTFMIIVGTVIIQGSSAKPIARWLGLERQQPQGILFIGANEAARFIAKYLQSNSVPVLLADTSRSNIIEARSLGLPVFEGSVLSENIFEEIDISNIGRLFGMTSNTEINMLACKRFQMELGEENVYRLVSKREVEIKELDIPKNLLFGSKADFINLIQSIRKKPKIHEQEINNEAEYEEFLDNNSGKIIPLFLKSTDAKFKVISGFQTVLSKGDKLIYIDNINTPAQIKKAE